jgi:hypothetical protein
MSSICMSWLGVEASFGSGATTGLEPVAFAVAVQRPEVTSCNFTTPIATFGARGNSQEFLLHPNRTQIF